VLGHHQNLTVCCYSLITPSPKLSSKFIDNFFSYPAGPNKETDSSSCTRKTCNSCRLYAQEYCETLNVRMPFYFLIFATSKNAK